MFYLEYKNGEFKVTNSYVKSNSCVACNVFMVVLIVGVVSLTLAIMNMKPTPIKHTKVNKHHTKTDQDSFGNPMTNYLYGDMYNTGLYGGLDANVMTPQ